MKPAWPSENWPVKPFTTLSETASTTLTKTVMRMRRKASGVTTPRAQKRGAPTTKGRKDLRIGQARMA
jgi:hypothetical protein